MQTLKEETITEGQILLMCKLTTPELQKRKRTVIAELKKEVIEKKELENGFAYKFFGSDVHIDTLTEFIKTERLCCGFFNFNLSIKNDGFIWLELTGPKGIKEFIQNEIDF
ncbi:MAG TPA: hypothetical protein VD908_04565 [Cytophagales bacterium]|nr:hypothetical protein [Cytophagales bacterium]